MANKASWLVVGLVFGALLGFLIGRGASGPVVHRIVVGPLPTDLALVLSSAAGDQVLWQSNASQNLKIVFAERNFPPEAKGLAPFDGMMKNADGDYEFSVTPCANGVCSSGRINPALGKLGSTYRLRYKYDQILGGVRADGHIIIKP